MGRPINWFVVLISICLLFANTTLTGRGIGGDYSAPGDSPSSAEALLRKALADVGTTYVARPAVVVTLDDALPESAALQQHRAFKYLAHLDDRVAASTATRHATQTSDWNTVASSDPFEFVEALDDERPVVTRVR
jgi:hypothetical protein